jgi:hypothetical protein
MEYVYTMKVRFSSIDDIEARKRLKEIGVTLPDGEGVVVEDALLETFKSKAPRKVVLR